ncbi:hypothetical protein Hanom_Chr03g00201671 [Helianthus anomalus]
MIMKFRRSLDRKSDLVGPDRFDFHSSSRSDGASPPPTNSDSFGGRFGWIMVVGGGGCSFASGGVREHNYVRVRLFGQ